MLQMGGGGMCCRWEGVPIGGSTCCRWEGSSKTQQTGRAGGWVGGWVWGWVGGRWGMGR